VVLAHETYLKDQARKVFKHIKLLLVVPTIKLSFLALVNKLRTFNSLLSRKSPNCLPSCDSSVGLASSFINFFRDKISKPCSSFATTSAFAPIPHSPPPSPPPYFSTFAPAAAEELRTTNLSSSFFLFPFLLNSAFHFLVLILSIVSISSLDT
jgi:hypothetical protein